MSRYFARLSQRSGFSAATPAAPSASAADIVEQNVEIDATPTIAASAAAPTVSPSGLAPPAPPPQTVQAPAAASKIPKPPSASPGAPVDTVPRPPSIAGAQETDISASPSISGFASARRETVTRGSSDSHAPIDQVETDTALSKPASFAPAANPEPNTVPAAKLNAAPLESAPRSARSRATPMQNQESLAVPVSASTPAPVSSPSLAATAAAISSPASEVFTRTQNVSHASNLARERSPFTDAPVSAVAASEVRAKNESSKNNVDVRIGAVRLEIHAPAPAAPEAAPTVSAREASRFVPRRHYLRG